MPNDISSEEKLKRLSRLIKEKEERRKQLEEEEKLTEEELENARKEAEQELLELRKDEEIMRLSDRIQLLEGRGTSDDDILRELELMGATRGAIVSAMRLHNMECTIHDHAIPIATIEKETEESLEQRVGDARELEANVFYDTQQRMEERNTFYDLASREMLDNLYQMRRTVEARGGAMTSNEYGVLQSIERQLEQKQDTYRDERNYARRESDVIRSIKDMGLRIGGDYVTGGDE